MRWNWHSGVQGKWSGPPGFVLSFEEAGVNMTETRTYDSGGGRLLFDSPDIALHMVGVPAVGPACVPLTTS